MATNTNDKNGKANEVAQIIAGAEKHFTNPAAKVTIDGESTTIGDALAKMQTFVDNRTAVVTAQASAHEKVVTERAQAPALLAFVDAFMAFVRVNLGQSPTALADFGKSPPKKRTPLTAEQNAIAAAKRRATREARGTMGPKQKERADFDEPLRALGVVELAAVA
jgi:hypothetical protein